MKRLFLTLVTCSFMLFACTANYSNSNIDSPNLSVEAQKIENIRAFTKLYGYVRYFHPSDEALVLDWEKFAIYGVDKVKSAQDSKELLQTLSDLFLPIAPTLNLSLNEKTKSVSNTTLTENDVYRVWQHSGLGGQYQGSLYKSSLLGEIPERYINPIFYTLKAPDSDAGKFKLQAKVKTRLDNLNYGGNLFLIALDANGKPIFEDYMRDRLIASDEWKTYEIIGEFGNEAQYLYFGAELVGSGEMWVDDFQLQSSSSGSQWSSIDINNSGFDEVEENGDIKNLIYDKDKGFKFSVLSENGNNVLHIKSPKTFKVGEVFDTYPKVGETVTKNIGLGIISEISLTVIPEKDKKINSAFEELSKNLELIDLSSIEVLDENVKLANALISWNVFQHFYPYFDVINVDWNQTLTDTLSETITSKTHNEFYNILRKMVAKTEDGHGVVYRENDPELASIPFKVEWIENEIVISASDSDLFKKGDIVRKIDGVTGEEALLNLKQYIAGSPQLKEFRALNQFGLGEQDSTAKLEIVRNDKTLNLEFKRENKKPKLFFKLISEFDFPSIKELEKGIFYVNRYVITKEEFYANIDKLANAKGVIIDNRWGKRLTTEDNNGGYISGVDIFPHLTDKPLISTKWQVPEITYPDLEKLKFDESNWSLQPKEPHFKGKTVVINMPSVVSSGETYLAFGNEYDLLKTVGETTAGTNGNINYINLIGGGRIMYTGMKVEKHDGSQLFINGYQPDYPVLKTIKAVKEGRDEYLEKALEVIKN